VPSQEQTLTNKANAVILSGAERFAGETFGAVEGPYREYMAPLGVLRLRVKPAERASRCAQDDRWFGLVTDV
jgi:hypothetical protein